MNHKNPQINTNDIIEMILDLNKFELSLFINKNEFTAKHINIENTQYIAAICVRIGVVNDGINLISIKLIETNHT